MGTSTRREREKQERRRRIVECARQIAEDEGWPAVTTRRLATEIEYTPPVLYGHFPDGRDGIVTAVAIDGFTRFKESVSAAVDGMSGPQRLTSFIHAYLQFADDNPATYEAMFTMDVTVAFADATSPPALREGFEVVTSVVTERAGQDRETVAEALWGALHGMWTLTREHRLRGENRAARVDVLVGVFG